MRIRHGSRFDHCNFGDGGGFGALLVDFDSGAVHGGVNFQRRIIDDIKKFRAVRERLTNANRLEIIGEDNLKRHTKFRQIDDDLAVERVRIFQAVKKIFAVGKALVVPKFCDVKGVFVDGHNQIHCRARAVGQLNPIKFVVGVIRNRFLENFLHHVGGEFFSGGSGEFLFDGRALFKRHCPLAFEVDDVEQIGHRIGEDGRNIIGDKAFSLVGNPTSNFFGFVSDVAAEFRLAHFRFVNVGHDALKIFVKPAFDKLFVYK